MHPEQNEREATIDTEDEKTICARERKNKENKRTNESIKLNKLSSHFSFSSNQKDKFKRLPPCRSHTKLFIFTIAEFCLGIILLYIFFPLLSLSLIARWTVLVYCWSFVVAKHLTKPIICYREDRLIIGRWQVPTICFHSFSYCYLAISHTPNRNRSARSSSFSNSSLTVWCVNREIQPIIWVINGSSNWWHAQSN